MSKEVKACSAYYKWNIVKVSMNDKKCIRLDSIRHVTNDTDVYF